ncbi:PREDICTED: cyclic [Prunus dulcis]|uniref:PREDICTED: cyclic n=1 Tax=Prunus dulcis TaxID=3755 RepID=A0A5E4GK08_PRUDU|nr:PREDICTED: cyclic [Prunus dulcis]
MGKGWVLLHGGMTIGIKEELRVDMVLCHQGDLSYHSCLKPKIFKENEMVIEAGQPLNAMLIIIAGSMLAYAPIRVATEVSPSTSFETLDKGMFVGEQLLDWAGKTKTFDDQPVSFKTIRCSKKVEAFALTIDDLETLVLSGHIFPMKSKGEA